MKLNIQEVSDYDYELGRINYEFKKERSSRRKDTGGSWIKDVKGSCWRRNKKGNEDFLDVITSHITVNWEDGNDMGE